MTYLPTGVGCTHLKRERKTAFPRLDLTFLTISPMLGIDTVLVVRLWSPSAKSIWKTFDEDEKSCGLNVQLQLFVQKSRS